jgi:hypothetical protein
MKEANKKCPICSHSRAAHLDGIRCALCGCMSERRDAIQESFAFRSSLLRRVTTNTRKR